MNDYIYYLQTIWDLKEQTNNMVTNGTLAVKNTDPIHKDSDVRGKGHNKTEETAVRQ